MPLSKDQKQKIITEMVSQMKDAKSIIFADYQGLSVKDLTTLRAKLREQGVNFQVAKKTLMKISAKEAGYEGDIPDSALEGPVGAAFSMEDEIAAAKILHTFAKDNKNLKLRGGLFENRVISIEEVKQLATLPGKEELLAKFVYLLKSPIQGFHGVLQNTIGGFVRVLDAIREKQDQKA